MQVNKLYNTITIIIILMSCTCVLNWVLTHWAYTSRRARSSSVPSRTYFHGFERQRHSHQKAGFSTFYYDPQSIRLLLKSTLITELFINKLKAKNASKKPKPIVFNEVLQVHKVIHNGNKFHQTYQEDPGACPF